MKQIGYKILLLLLLCSFTTNRLDSVRSNYSKVATDKALCAAVIAELKQSQPLTATHLAYLGGVQTIWAKHVFNPISKINTFNEGKRNIERAVSLEPENAEIRFVRLSVQKNAPGFLGYSSHISEDIAFIRQHRAQLQSTIVQHYVESLLH